MRKTVEVIGCEQRKSLWGGRNKNRVDKGTSNRHHNYFLLKCKLCRKITLKKKTLDREGVA